MSQNKEKVAALLSFIAARARNDIALHPGDYKKVEEGHGFYSATNDNSRFEAIWWRRSGGQTGGMRACLRAGGEKLRARIQIIRFCVRQNRKHGRRVRTRNRRLCELQRRRCTPHIPDGDIRATAAMHYAYVRHLYLCIARISGGSVRASLRAISLPPRVMCDWCSRRSRARFFASCSPDCEMRFFGSARARTRC